MMCTCTSSDVILVGEARGVCIFTVSLSRVFFCGRQFVLFYYVFFSAIPLLVSVFQKQMVVCCVVFFIFFVSKGFDKTSKRVSKE